VLYRESHAKVGMLAAVLLHFLFIYLYIYIYIYIERERERERERGIFIGNSAFV
jgi:hypothetical protein